MYLDIFKQYNKLQTTQYVLIALFINRPSEQSHLVIIYILPFTHKTILSSQTIQSTKAIAMLTSIACTLQFLVQNTNFITTKIHCLKTPYFLVVTTLKIELVHTCIFYGPMQKKRRINMNNFTLRRQNHLLHLKIHKCFMDKSSDNFC